MFANSTASQRHKKSPTRKNNSARPRSFKKDGKSKLVRSLFAANRVMENQREELTSRYIFKVLSGINTPVSLGVWLRWKYNQRALVDDLSCNPRNYNAGHGRWNLDFGLDFAKDFAAYNLLRKAEFLDTGIDTRAVALAKFAAGEEQCRDTNRRLLVPPNEYKDVRMRELLYRAAYKIDRVLDPLCIEDLLDSSDWGPGRTVQLKAGEACAAIKFANEGGITPALSAVLTPEMFSRAFPRWGEILSRNVTHGNVVTTVDKDASTKRVIAYEPGLNLYLQKGMGAILRRHLLKVGIDLDRQEFNQLAAKYASITADVATVDFSSASDTISRELVKILFDVSEKARLYFRVMDVLRSRCGWQGGDSPVTYEKFSSMGNGFTFELETLIFWALAKVTAEEVGDNKPILVYGDDVILGTKSYPLYIELSKYCGFTVNQRKSYADSYFRESCGAYWWNGVSCKPHFLKEWISDVSECYKNANATRRLADELGFGLLHSCRLRGAWRHLYHAVPQSLRLCVPGGVGDGGFAVPFDIALPGLNLSARRRANDGFEGYRYLALRETPQEFRIGFVEDPMRVTAEQLRLGHGLLLTRLRTPSTHRPYGETYTVRDRTIYTFTMELCPTWFETDQEAEYHRFRVSVGSHRLKSMGFDHTDNDAYVWKPQQNRTRKRREAPMIPESADVSST